MLLECLCIRLLMLKELLEANDGAYINKPIFINDIKCIH
jgi:hypothetical protein